MATETITNQELHIVVAALGGKTNKAFIGYTAVSAPLTYDEAIALWDKLGKDLHAGIRRSGGGVRYPSHVLHYAVRSVQDPRFAPLVGRGYADARDRKTGRLASYGDRGRVKAAKVWAKANGYKGAGGGWIYGPDGKPHTQGWDSLALELIRRGYIAQGSDGLSYIIDQELVQ